jgi:hypothetical protein
MKKTAAATKQKATKTPATATPAQEAVTAAGQPKKATRPARKAEATGTAKKTAEVISTPAVEKEKASPKKVAPIVTKAAGASKKDIVLALISRKDGATLAEIIEATAWQKHTVRGFISILGKAGAKIESSKSEAGARTYKAA